MTTIRMARCAALLLLSACSSRSDSRVPSDTAGTPDSSSGAASPAPGSAAPAASSTPAAFQDSTSRDLTGDGAPERLTLRAVGSRFDSLAVALEIRDGRTGALLHSARWNSRDYFKYARPDRKPESAAREADVRGYLGEVFAKGAFVTPRMTLPGGRIENIDTGVVRYHLMELDWRRAHGVADTASTPPAAETELAARPATSAALRARTDAVIAELRGRPTFTLFEGGELRNTIAWSDREHAFVRVFSCC
jgi:hypothetical protein